MGIEPKPSTALPDGVPEERSFLATSRDCVRSALSRAHELQPAFNAFATIDDRAALATEGHVERGPLAGVPVSVKDILDVAGLPTRWGSPLFADAPPAKTDIEAVARLRRAGA